MDQDAGSFMQKTGHGRDGAGVNAKRGTPRKPTLPQPRRRGRGVDLV
jgi:hypothetical protein